MPHGMISRRQGLMALAAITSRQTLLRQWLDYGERLALLGSRFDDWSPATIRKLALVSLEVDHREMTATGTFSRGLALQ